MLRILLDFSLKANYKSNRFSKTLPKKSFKFVLSSKNNIVAFNLGFMLLPAKVDSIWEKQSCKRYTLEACDPGYVKIVLALLTKVVAFYIRAIIVQVEVLGSKDLIPRCNILFAIFFSLNKQF